MEEKKEIRKKIFKARKEHTDAWIRENSLRITEALTQLPEYRNAERIMAYADYNHEVITRYIIEQAWKDGKEVAVPKVFGKDMVFYRLTDFSQLESGYFGIPEPKEDGETVSWEEAMMVMPGVAFDINCNRVGYGGGFYDRFLEKHPEVCSRIFLPDPSGGSHRAYGYPSAGHCDGREYIPRYTIRYCCKDRKKGRNIWK